MDYFEMGVQAKRNQQFDLALKYYEMEQKQEGVTVALLMALGKIYHLKRDNKTAIQFYLAATHLAMHIHNFHLMRNFDNVRETLDRLPTEMRRQLPHEIAGMIYFNLNYAKHISHSVLDAHAASTLPQLKPYADIYYASILGDGSVKSVCDNYNLSERDLLKYEEEEYFPIGFKVLLENIQWNQIDSSNVYSIYF